MYTKCPYCFEEIEEDAVKCSHCAQYFLDKPMKVDYKGIDKKRCVFCGKDVLKEARICKFCRKWLDEVQRAADDVEHLEGDT